jgi:hypothetical protein
LSPAKTESAKGGMCNTCIFVCMYVCMVVCADDGKIGVTQNCMCVIYVYGTYFVVEGNVRQVLRLAYIHAYIYI